MIHDLVIVGAGGFGRETIDVVRSVNAVRSTWNLLGVIDDAPSAINLERLSPLGVPHLGGLESMPHGVAVAVAIGTPRIRARVVKNLAFGEHEFPTLLHSTVTIGGSFRHGPGLIALAGVSIGTNVDVGSHVHLNPHAVLGHDVVCHDYVSINPNATLSGDCVVGSRTLLGANSTVLQQLTLGADVIVGAAACVTRSVPDGHTVIGVPARTAQNGGTAR